jgi:hypothetical protein
MPKLLPADDLLIYLSGVAEIFLDIGILYFLKPEHSLFGE